MVSKERINKSKLYFRVIKLRIIFHLVKDHLLRPFIHLFSFHFHHFFDSLFPFLVPFSTFCFDFAHFYFSNLPSNIRHLTAYSSRGDFSSPLPPNVGGDPWSSY